jgi:hypothetical protein
MVSDYPSYDAVTDDGKSSVLQFAAANPNARTIFDLAVDCARPVLAPCQWLDSA